jgi:hypothetical protein
LRSCKIQSDGGEGIFDFVGQDTGERADFRQAGGVAGIGLGAIGAAGLLAKAALGRRADRHRHRQTAGQSRQQSWDKPVHNAAARLASEGAFVPPTGIQGGPALTGFGRGARCLTLTAIRPLSPHEFRSRGES